MSKGIHTCGGVGTLEHYGENFILPVENAIHLISDVILPDEPTRTIEIREPWGTTRPHDSDRMVDEYEFHAGQDVPLSVAIMRQRGDVVRWHIIYNLSKIEPLGPTEEGWRLLRRHERFHTKGYAHGEGSPKTNGCFSRLVNLQA